jgi:hypothetical protein
MSKVSEMSETKGDLTRQTFPVKTFPVNLNIPAVMADHSPARTDFRYLPDRFLTLLLPCEVTMLCSMSHFPNILFMILMSAIFA